MIVDRYSSQYTKDREEDEELQRLKQLKSDYHFTFNTEEGKRVLEHLGTICFRNATTMQPGINAEGNAHNCGMRNVYLIIEQMLEDYEPQEVAIDE